MRILPVNNYNYQFKTPNNQKQNVNFGMFKGDVVDAERLCKSAGFTKLEERLTKFLANVGKKIRNISGEITDGRKFDKDEITRLKDLVKQTKEANIVMSPKEQRSIAIVLSTTEDSLKSRFRFKNSDFTNGHFLDLLEAIIKRAKPVTEPIQKRLTEIDFCTEEIAKYERLHSEGFMNEDTASALTLDHLRRANDIKLELYAASIAK